LKLSDDDLLLAYQRASSVRYVAAERKLAQEILSRPSLDSKVDKAQVCGALCELETDPARALALIEQARRIDRDKRRSCGPWDLIELELRIARGETAEVQRLFDHLRLEHAKEPDVGRALMQLLVNMGVVAPDGTMRGPAPSAVPREGAAAVEPAAAEPSKLWTPDSAAAPSGKKSAIWTPGMD
jgi:hypothetical protein